MTPMQPSPSPTHQPAPGAAPPGGSAPSHRLYIIGTGKIAELHAEGLPSLPAAIETHACDLDPARLAAFTRRFPHVQGHPDATAMLSGPAEPGDIVLVATPPCAPSSRLCTAATSGSPAPRPSSIFPSCRRSTRSPGRGGR